MNIQGTLTAMVTPFRDQKLDLEGLAHNINYQLSQGVNGIVVLGSTGENFSLTAEEKASVIATAIKETKHRIPVMVGTGSYCTRTTIQHTMQAKDLGADIAMIVTPYYNRPTQEGIFRHFEAITTEVDIPVMIYNIPSRCGTNIEPSTLARIAELPNIIGVKESSGNFVQAGDIIQAISRKHSNFRLFAGDDIFILPMIALGAVGVISVVSNLVPKRIVALVNAALQGQFELAREHHYQLLPLYKALFIETNPVPIKTAMHLCQMPSGDCRLPLAPLTSENLQTLHQLLQQMQLINH